MEACTSYYKLYKGFKKIGINVLVANVIHLRRIVGKNDVIDAERLADMLRLNSIPESFIPEDKIQHLRTLVNLHYRLVKQNTRLKNQIHAILDMEGINIGTRTPFCKTWCIRLQKYIAEYDNIELRHLFEAWRDVHNRITSLAAELIGYAKRNFGKEHELLVSIPGFGELFASYLIAQIMPISRFVNNKKLRRYAGVIPVSDRSDQNVYRTYIPKCTSRTLLRYVLVEGAHCAIKTKTNLSAYYKKKKKTKHPNQALMCVARMLSDTIYDVLTKKEPFVM
jgi:transposase